MQNHFAFPDGVSIAAPPLAPPLAQHLRRRCSYNLCGRDRALEQVCLCVRGCVLLQLLTD